MTETNNVGTYFITITLVDEIGTESEKYYYSIVLLDKIGAEEIATDEA